MLSPGVQVKKLLLEVVKGSEVLLPIRVLLLTMQGWKCQFKKNVFTKFIAGNAQEDADRSPCSGDTKAETIKAE
jgi:hypothetical protein